MPRRQTRVRLPLYVVVTACVACRHYHNEYIGACDMMNVESCLEPCITKELVYWRAKGRGRRGRQDEKYPGLRSKELVDKSRSHDSDEQRIDTGDV